MKADLIYEQLYDFDYTELVINPTELVLLKNLPNVLIKNETIYVTFL